MKEVKIEVLRFSISDQEKFAMARQIRSRVFVEEQMVDARDEFDQFEANSEHYLLMVDDKVIGTARWRVNGDSVKLERFAVEKAFRNKGYGHCLLTKVIEDAKAMELPIYLHAQLKAIPFYERQGFQKEGGRFLECNIEHFKMVLAGEINF